MSRPMRKAGAVAVLAITLMTATVPTAAEPAAALPVELQYVPTDALAFVHADAEALLGSALGRTFLKAKLPMLDAELKDVSDKFGLTLADLRTVTAFMPDVGNRPGFGFVLTTLKPYDREKIVGQVEKLADEEMAKFENKDNVLRVEFEGEKFYIDLTDPKRIVIGLNLGADPKADPKRKAGVHSPTLAEKNAVLLGGFNFTLLPDELRREVGNDLPRELRPLQGLLGADSATLVGRLSLKELTATATVRSPDKETAARVEKALGGLRAEIGKAIDFVEEELKVVEEVGDDVKEYRPLLTVARAALKAANITTNGTTTTATATVPTDAPFGPFAELLAGARQTKLAAEQNNLKQLMLAMHNYHDAMGAMPAVYTTGEKGKPLLSWRVAILPYIEQDHVYKQFKLDEPWDSEHNLKVVKDHPMPAVFLHIADKADDKKTRYRVFTGNDAGLDVDKKLTLVGITDGTSNTVAIVTAAEAVPWTKPEGIAFDPKKDVTPLLKFLGGRSNVTMFDGSVRPLRKGIKEETLKAMLTRSGGEIIPLDDD